MDGPQVVFENLRNIFYFFPEYGHATSVVIQDAKKQEKFDQSKPQAMDWIKSQARKTFSKKNLYKKVPVLEWLPKYNVETGLFTFLFCFNYCCKQTNRKTNY